MEWLAAEYPITFAQAVWEIPLVVAMVMLPVRNERLGGTAGPSYSLKASLKAKNRAHDFLKEHFEIVDADPAEVGWRLGENTYLKI